MTLWQRGASSFLLSAAVHAAILASLCVPMPAGKPPSPLVRVALREIPRAEPKVAPAAPPAAASPKPAPALTEKIASEPVPPKPVPPKPVPQKTKKNPAKPTPSKPARPKPRREAAPVAPPKPAEVQPVQAERPEPAAFSGMESAEAPRQGPAAPFASNSVTNSGPRGSSAAPPGGVVDISSLTVTKKISPAYPMICRRRGEEGTVVLIVSISSGAVSKVNVEKSSGHPALDESAVSAVRGWKFDSGSPDGVRARIPVSFSLK